LIQPTNIVPPEVLIESCYTYKQQEDYLCFDCDFNNDDDADDETGSNVSIPPSIIPTTTTTTAAADLLLSLINQVPATSSPPSPTSLSPFNFSYINVTPPQTTSDPSTDSNTVRSSSSDRAMKTLYALLSSHLLIPSQFIKLPHGDNHYCTVLTSTKRGLLQCGCHQF